MKFKKNSPLTGELVQEYEYVSNEEIERSLGRLHLSFLSWKDLSPSERQKKLGKFAFRLSEKKFEIADKISEEMGKLYPDSLVEVEKCIQSFGSWLEMDLAFLSMSKSPSCYKESLIVNTPLGVIYSIMPWNYPLWQAFRMIIPTLLAGNVVLLKHSEICPEIGRMIEDIFADSADAPLLLHRMASHEMTELILSDSRIQGVSLTGSTKAGVVVSSLAGKYLKRTVLELGGSDPYIVYPDADLTIAAQAIAKSRLQNAGQSCIGAKRCLVHKSIQTEFLSILKSEFSKYEFGLARDAKAKIGCLADVKFKIALQNQIQEMIQHTEAELIFNKSHGQSESSAFVNSQIYALPRNSEWLKDQEFFAPVLLVIPFETEDEAIQIANSTNFGLGGGVFSKDLQFARQQAMKIVAGQIAINDYIRSDISLPFGGNKMSGLGRELGQNGFFEFTSTKVVSNS